MAAEQIVICGTWPSIVIALFPLREGASVTPILPEEIGSEANEPATHLSDTTAQPPARILLSTEMSENTETLIIRACQVLIF